MDPRRVLTFRAVAHERSFSRRGARAALTQPAVSQQVAALEREVGARLLDREPGGLELTRAGRGRCSRTPTRSPSGFALASAQLAELRAARARLRIGAFPSALAALVPQASRAARRSRRRGAASRRADARARPSGSARGELHLARRLPGRGASRGASTTGTERRDLLQRAVPGRARARPPARRARRGPARRARRGAAGSAPSGDGLIARACRAAGFEMRLVDDLARPARQPRR